MQSGPKNRLFHLFKDHLAKLVLPSLELRRLCLDLIYCYKIVFGLVQLKLSLFFEFSVCSTRDHAYKCISRDATVLECIFFTNRVLHVLNSLPGSVMFSSLGVTVTDY